MEITRTIFWKTNMCCGTPEYLEQLDETRLGQWWDDNNNTGKYSGYLEAYGGNVDYSYIFVPLDKIEGKVKEAIEYFYNYPSWEFDEQEKIQRKVYHPKLINSSDLEDVRHPCYPGVRCRVCDNDLCNRYLKMEIVDSLICVICSCGTKTPRFVPIDEGYKNNRLRLLESRRKAYFDENLKRIL